MTTPDAPSIPPCPVCAGPRSVVHASAVGLAAVAFWLCPPCRHVQLAPQAPADLLVSGVLAAAASAPDVLPEPGTAAPAPGAPGTRLGFARWLADTGRITEWPDGASRAA